MFAQEIRNFALGADYRLTDVRTNDAWASEILFRSSLMSF